MKIYFARNLGQRFKNAKRMGMISKSQDKLKHGLKKFKKQLVPMNPNNQVNYKLTLNLKELKEIANLTKELKRILESD